jgi:hypothetical protein
MTSGHLKNDFALREMFVNGWRQGFAVSSSLPKHCVGGNSEGAQAKEVLMRGLFILPSLLE